MEPIRWADYANIVVLTGAGVSVASGLRPYRGPGGLWEEEGLAELADVGALRRDPAAVWRFFAAARQAARTAAPNPAHEALAAIERGLPSGRRFTLITQNIDGLHQRAGSHNVLELHGSLSRSRCSAPDCALEPYLDDGPATLELPRCPRCGAPLRPDVVLFGEPLPVAAEHGAKRALRDCDLFLAAGTSGTVAPASSFVRWAEYAGARTILVNREPMEPPHPSFAEQLLGPAEELLPALVGGPG